MKKLESPPPQKQHRIAHSQVGQESPIIGPGKQKQPRMSNSSTFCSHAGASSSSSDRPQLFTPQVHAPSFEVNPSLPFLDPVASDSSQSPGDSCTEVSGHFVDGVLLLHTRAYRPSDQSDDGDSKDSLEEDAVEAVDSVDQVTDEFWNGEDSAMEDVVDPHEGIVSDWDLLAEEFTVEAEELGQFECSLLHTPDSLALLCSGESSISDHDLDILRPFGMKIRNNLTTLAFHEMSYNFCKAGMVNLAKTRSHVRALSHFEPMKFACCINSCICYTGPYADLDECTKCKTSHLNESGRVKRTFSYIPLIPRLCVLMSNPTYATRLQYCADAIDVPTLVNFISVLLGGYSVIPSSKL